MVDNNIMTTNNDNSNQLTQHPIQLEDLKVMGMSIIDRIVQLGLNEEDIDIVRTITSVGHSSFNPEKKLIVVGLNIETDNEYEKNPYALKVDVRGKFKIDTEHFKEEHIEDWANHGAQFVLMPYLREIVYSLTQKAGYEPLILPLVQVNTVKYE